MNRIIFLLAIAGYVSPGYCKDDYLTQEVPIKGLGIHLEMGDDDPVAQESFEDLEAEQRDNGKGYLIAAVPTPGEKKYNIFDVRGFNEWLFGPKLYGTKLLRDNDPLNAPIKTVNYYKLSNARDAFEYVGNLSDLTSHQPTALKGLLQKWYSHSRTIDVTFFNPLKYPVILLVVAKKVGAPLLDTIIEPEASYVATINLDDAGKFAYIGHLNNAARLRIARKLQGTRFQKIGIPLAKKIVLKDLSYGQRISIN